MWAHKKTYQIFVGNSVKPYITGILKGKKYQKQVLSLVHSSKIQQSNLSCHFLATPFTWSDKCERGTNWDSFAGNGKYEVACMILVIFCANITDILYASKFMTFHLCQGYMIL